MKSFDVIRKDKRFQTFKSGEDGGNGWVTIRGKTFSVIYSNGDGWDHVSVCGRDRCPSWDEMCIVKDIFFNDNEWCLQYHPAKNDYVNIQKYCLHIWKPQNRAMPIPPSYMV